MLCHDYQVRTQFERLAPERGDAAGRLAKRTFDIVFGTLLATAALPVMLALAVCVAVSLRTWKPVFVQERVGRTGMRFRIVKLRTLPLRTPPAADKYAIASVVTTRFCRFLRRHHIDELPQLFLVPLGYMSLVGPRPEMPHLLDEFEHEFVAARSSVRPGCTGLWQVSHAVEGLIGEAPHYDLYYVRNSNFWLDCWILWCTIRVLIARSGVSLSDVPAWCTPADRHGGLVPAHAQ